MKAYHIVLKNWMLFISHGASNPDTPINHMEEEIKQTLKPLLSDTTNHSDTCECDMCRIPRDIEALIIRVTDEILGENDPGVDVVGWARNTLLEKQRIKRDELLSK